LKIWVMPSFLPTMPIILRVPVCEKPTGRLEGWRVGGLEELRCSSPLVL
jgi:hypothetical protein